MTPTPREQALTVEDISRMRKALLDGKFDCVKGVLLLDLMDVFSLAEVAINAALPPSPQTAERGFPVLGPLPHDCPSRVCWSKLDEGIAMKNHGGQSLEKLASRGGLCPEEIYCVRHTITDPMEMRAVTREQGAAECRAIAYPPALAAPAPVQGERVERLELIAWFAQQLEIDGMGENPRVSPAHEFGLKRLFQALNGIHIPTPKLRALAPPAEDGEKGA